MKKFEKLVFDFHTCQKELTEFKDLLDAKKDLSESTDILPFFREHKHLSAFLGSYGTYISKFDRIAHEYQLFGDFSCDLVVGDSSSHWYCFIEFENANEKSIFEMKGKKVTPEWGSRFEHGFSQIIDWFWKLEDMKNTMDMRSRFDSEFIQYYGMLVIGRDSHLALNEKHRKQWRVEKVLIDSKSIICVTFDQLYDDLNYKLNAYRSIGSAGI